MSDTWITVANFSTPHEAELARGFLENDGIDVLFPDDATARIASHLTPMIGWIRLQVPEPQAARARVLLAGVGHLPPEDAD